MAPADSGTTPLRPRQVAAWSVIVASMLGLAALPPGRVLPPIFATRAAQVGSHRCTPQEFIDQIRPRIAEGLGYLIVNLTGFEHTEILERLTTQIAPALQGVRSALSLPRAWPSGRTRSHRRHQVSAPATNAARRSPRPPALARTAIPFKLSMVPDTAYLRLYLTA